MPTTVYYYIPEDKDTLDHPNVFSFRNTGGEIKFKDVRNAFPLPGQYHFRFKVKQEASFFWMDVTNDDVVVPLCQGKIIMKVLRISWEGGAGASNGAVAEEKKPRQQPAPPSAATGGYPQSQTPANNLLGMDDTPQHKPQQPAMGSMDGFDSMFGAAPSAPSPPVDDFANFGSWNSSPSAPKPQTNQSTNGLDDLF
jgi:hypothetical protein